MSKDRIKEFINIQFENLEDGIYKIEEDENHIYAIFTEVLGKNVSKEITFKILNDILYLHSVTYGWKPVKKGNANKYFWIELLSIDK